MIRPKEEAKYKRDNTPAYCMGEKAIIEKFNRTTVAVVLLNSGVSARVDFEDCGKVRE